MATQTRCRALPARVDRLRTSPLAVSMRARTRCWLAAGGLVQHRHRTVHAADADEAFGQPALRGCAQRGLGGEQALGQTLDVLQQRVQRERLGLGLLEQGRQEVEAGQRVLQLALSAGFGSHCQLCLCLRLRLRLFGADVKAVALVKASTAC